MSVDFTVQDQQGNKFDTSSEHMIDSLRAGGYQPVGASPDGMTLTLKDNQGTYDINAQDYLKSKGLDVVESKPQSPDYSAVSPELRASISALPDDGLKRFYLERHFKEQGLDKPQVTGSGRDWFVFNPETNKWLAVTNSPEWGMADLAEAAASAPRVIGAALGGTGGFLGGGILGSAAGAGLGGAGGQAIAQTALAAMDPDFSAAVEENPGAFDKELLKTGLTDAAFGALPAALRNSEFGRFVASPLSSISKGVGAVVEPVGALASSAAKIADQGAISRGIGTSFIPGLNTFQNAGIFGRAPAKITSWLAENLGGMRGGLSALEHGPVAAGRETTSEEALSALGRKFGGEGLGRQTGQLFDRLSDLGGGLERAAEGVYSAGAKAVGKAGDVLNQSGSVFRGVGDALKPYEPYLFGEPAAEEARARLFKGQKSQSQPLPQKPLGSTI